MTIGFFDRVSFHPKLAAGLEFFFLLVAVWWLNHVTRGYILLLWLGVTMGWSALVVKMMYFPPSIRRLPQMLSLLSFLTGMMLLIIFVDDHNVRLLLSAVTVVIPAISLALVPAAENTLTILTKPYRRWIFLMTIFGVAGLWVGVTASAVFQLAPRYLLWLLILVAGAVTVLVSLAGWRTYGLPFDRRQKLAAGALFLFLVECGYLLVLLPLGYMVSSFLLTWLWYVSWLILRFYLSPEGIDWRKQRWFLATNGVALVVFLLMVARWK